MLRRSLLAAVGLLAACSHDTAPATVLAPIDLPAGSPLQSLGGLLLNRDVIGFGGLSGLHIGPDLALTAVSDTGRWLKAQLVLDDAGHPQALQALRSGSLSDGLLFNLPGRFSRDAESLARLPDGSWLVGYERWQRIRAYTTLEDWGHPAEAPPGLGYAPLNEGLESLAVLADGRWLAITEGLQDGAPDLLRGWVGGPGAWHPFSYHATPGFVPTDAAPLPDGGALVVERAFSLLGGFQGRLRRLSAASLASPRPGTILEPETLLDTLPTENWEGVSSFPHRGRQLVAMLTDDNEIFLQKGLLLLFAFR